MPDDTFSWTDVEDLGIELHEAYPDKDPTNVRFTELRELVEKLDCFEPEPGQSVNEQILEAIQAAWIEEHKDAGGGRGDDDDDDPGYTPHNALRPD